MELTGLEPRRSDLARGIVIARAARPLDRDEQRELWATLAAAGVTEAPEEAGSEPREASASDLTRAVVEDTAAATAAAGGDADTDSDSGGDDPDDDDDDKPPRQWLSGSMTSKSSSSGSSSSSSPSSPSRTATRSGIDGESGAE